MSHKNNDADIDFIAALAELLGKNELTEISVTRDHGEAGSLNVRVVKQAPPPQNNPVYVAPPPSGFAPQYSDGYAGAPGSAPQPPQQAPAPTIEDPAQHPGAVSSPMVGTCYLSPEPGAAAFITVGSAVTEGQTVLIIEAMKTMNHIPSPRAGTVKRILVEDGSAVEYGTPLVIIE